MASKQVSRNCQELGSSLHGNNGPQRAEICGTSFIIITLSYDSCPNVVFTRHSCFPDLKVPRVCSENLSKKPPRGQKRVAGMTDWWSTLVTYFRFGRARPRNKISGKEALCITGSSKLQSLFRSDLLRSPWNTFVERKCINWHLWQVFPSNIALSPPVTDWFPRSRKAALLLNMQWRYAKKSKQADLRPRSW